jgi:hypothetical protein
MGFRPALARPAAQHLRLLFNPLFLSTISGDP